MITESHRTRKRKSPKMQRLLFIIAAISPLAINAAEPPPGLLLARDGRALAVIVVGAEPSRSTENAARILREHLQQISGAEFRVIDDSRIPDDTIRIAVGESKVTRSLGIDAAELGPGGIHIQTFPSTIVLVGGDEENARDPDGTHYAVTTFLEEYLDVRFLWPGELGKVVPQRKSIRIGPIKESFTPMLRQRKIRMHGGFDRRMAIGGRLLDVDAADFERVMTSAKETVSFDSGWGKWHRMGGSLGLASGHSFGHMWEKYGEKHPEWFAMAPNGSRDQSASPERSRLCVSNPELFRTIADELIARINETGQSSVAIGPNDGGQTTFCVCRECEALDAPSDRKIELIDFSPGANRRVFEHVPLTDRYVHFWNGIARRVTAVHPDTWLTADAYSAYRSPPVRAKLHPNIAIRFVGVSYVNEQLRRQGLADWDAWSNAASRIYFRSNHLLASRREGTAVVYAQRQADDFRRLAPRSMIGTDLDSCMHNWATQGLNYYAMAKLLWDPELDIDLLIDDYCRSGFGEGADVVKRYFLRLEELSVEFASQQQPVTAPFTPERVTELRALLDEAAAAVDRESDEHRRVEFLRVGLEYTAGYSTMMRRFYAWKEAGAQRTDEHNRQLRAAIEQNWLNSRDIFENHPLAVNVCTVAWGSWGLFRQTRWSGPSEELLERWESRK